MSILNKLRRQASAGLGILREQPKARTTRRASTAARRQPAAQATRGGFNTVLLEAGDFRAGVSRVGEWAPIAAFRVPHGVRYAIPKGRNFRMYLKARKGVNPAGAEGTQTVAGLDGLVDTAQAKPNLPGTWHPEVAVWVRVAGVWKQATIEAVDYAAGTVDYTEPADTTAVEVYYVATPGEFRFRVNTAKGAADTSAVTVHNGSIAAVHTVDQNNKETSHKWPRDVSIVPGQQLQLEVKSDVEFRWNDRAAHELTIISHLQQLRIRDERALRRAAELDLRAGG